MDTPRTTGPSHRRDPVAATSPHVHVLGSTSIISMAEAWDQAYDGRLCRLVRADGSSRVVPTHLWSGTASPAEVALFVAPCTGPTLDVGCGPGRLSEALSRRGIEVLGIDVSAAAVRQTRRRGADAVCLDVFEAPDRPGSWRHVLLTDGNIGIGGAPQRLLSHLAPLLDPDGTILVEVAATGGVAVEHLRMQVAHQTSGTFAWATVGLDAAEELARVSGLQVQDVTRAAGRTVVTMSLRPPRDRDPSTDLTTRPSPGAVLRRGPRATPYPAEQ